MMKSLETRLRNAIITFINISKRMSYLDAFREHIFQVDNTIKILVKNRPLLDLYFYMTDSYSIDGILLGISKEQEVVGEAIVTLTSNHKMIAKIDYLSGGIGLNRSGMRGLISWIRQKIKNGNNIKKFIRDFEMFNLSLI